MPPILDTGTTEWFYSDGGRACGPYPASLLLELLRRRGDPGQAIVRPDPRVPWTRLCDVPELAHAMVHGAPASSGLGRARPQRLPTPGQRWKAPRTSYVAQHWRGELGLAQSFWLNSTGLGLLLGATLLGTSNRLIARFDNSGPVLAGALVLLFAWAVCDVWLKVGTWRASTQARRRRPSAWIGVTRFLLVCGWISLCVFVPVRTMALIQPTTQGTLLPVNGATVRANGTRIDFFGPVSAPATASLRLALAQAPGVTLIRLQSGGGLVGEARKMATMIRDHRLDSEAVGTCASACTLMFLAGAERRLAPGARLGFHSYRSPTATPLQLLEEEATDEGTFRAAGVPTWFIQHTFATPPSGIWFPGHEELLSANILTGGVPPPVPAMAAIAPPLPPRDLGTSAAPAGPQLDITSTPIEPQAAGAPVTPPTTGVPVENAPIKHASAALSSVAAGPLELPPPQPSRALLPGRRHASRATSESRR